MRDFYAERVKEENEDLETKGDKGVNVEMTDKEFDQINLLALKVGFKSAGQLLESFVGDLTEWHSNGSDERHMANDWFDRAFGIWKETRYFFRYHLYNNEIEAEDFEDDEDYFEEVYNEYLEEADNKDHESKEQCIAIIKEIIKDNKSKE